MLTVGTIIKESLDATLKFAAWYRAQGADRIVMHFDDPNDPAIEHFRDIDWVTCVRCTPEFWAGMGVTPNDPFPRRQNMAMTRAYRSLEKGWFLNVDGDELLFAEGRTTLDILLGMSDDALAVRFDPVEHVQTPDHADAQYFRQAMPRWARRKVYGDFADAMKPRRGLVGHHIGKSATRAGLGSLKMRQHWAQDDNGNEVNGHTLGASDGVSLLHFVDQGYDVWRAKVEWRLSSNGYRGEIRERLDAILANEDPEPALRALYDAMHVFDSDRVDALMASRAGLRLELDFEAPVKEHLPASAR